MQTSHFRKIYPSHNSFLENGDNLLNVDSIPVMLLEQSTPTDSKNSSHALRCLRVMRAIKTISMFPGELEERCYCVADEKGRDSRPVLQAFTQY